MSLLTVNKIYFMIHMLLAVSYLLFICIRAITRFFSLSIGHRYWIVIGQVLVLVAIATPVTFYFTPSDRLSAIRMPAFQTAFEGSDFQASQWPSINRERSSFAAIDSNPKVKLSGLENLFEWVSADGSVSALFFAILLVIAMLFARTALKLRRLRLTLLTGATVRSIRRVKIVVSDEISIPFSVWMGRTNWVAMPSSVVMNRGDFRLALRHELEHHRQGDTRWALLIELLLSVFFSSPFIFLWKRRISELQEFSCDEALVGRVGVSSHDYGSCLVRLAEAALESREMYIGTTYMASAFGNPFYAKSFLRRRIEMFANYNVPRTRKWVGVLVGTAATLGTIAIALGAEQAMRKDEKSVNPGMVIVDPSIQKIADRALRDAVKSENAKTGVAIVADPNTGNILAVAEVDTTGKLPKYWALGQILEPASFAKPIVAAQAIESGLTAPQETHFCENGNYRYGTRVYHDWSEKGWEHLTTEEIITNSSDICTIKIAEKIGTEGLLKMLVYFGFGPDGTARSYPQSRPGILPPIQNPYWPETVPAVSAGYGFKVTPLEILQAYGAIANGGNLLMPKVANENSVPQIIRRVLSAENASKMREILRGVVLKGTAKGKASSAFYSTAGKTSTSFIPDLTQWELVEGKKKGNFAGFVGFAPVKAPRIEVYVGIFDPRDGDKSGAHGSAHAAPVFKRIIEETLQHFNVAPDSN